MIYFTNSLTQEELIAAVLDVFGENELFGDENEPLTRKRERYRLSIAESVWGRALGSPELAVEGSFPNKKFRRRFRVPYRLFVDILVPLCKEANILSTYRTINSRPRHK